MSDKKPKKKMTAKQLANLKPPIKKGEVRNPRGAAAHNGVKAIIRKLTKESLKDMIEKIANGTVSDLKKVVEDPNATALEVALATSLVKVINKGDYDQLETMLTRVVGKVKDELDVTSDGKSIQPDVKVNVYLPANGRTKEENQK